MGIESKITPEYWNEPEKKPKKRTDSVLQRYIKKIYDKKRDNSELEKCGLLETLANRQKRLSDMIEKTEHDKIMKETKELASFKNKTGIVHGRDYPRASFFDMYVTTPYGIVEKYFVSVERGSIYKKSYCIVHSYDGELFFGFGIEPDALNYEIRQIILDTIEKAKRTEPSEE